MGVDKAVDNEDDDEADEDLRARNWDPVPVVDHIVDVFARVLNINTQIFVHFE